MSKRQRKHNSLVSSVLAAALAFTAIVSSVQLADVSGDLVANVSGRYLASGHETSPDSGTPPAGDTNYTPPAGDITCPDGSVHPSPYTCPTNGGSASSYVTQPTCQSAGFFWGATTNYCYNIALDRDTAEGSTAGSGSGSCTSGQYWDAASSTCKTSTAGTGNGTAGSYVTELTCQSAGFSWYNSVCNSTGAGTADTTAYPAGTCPQGSTNAGQSYPAGTGTPPCGTTTDTGSGAACPSATPFRWGDNTCHATAETVGSCQSGTYWDSGSSTCKPTPDGSTTSPDAMSAACTSGGGTWDAASFACITPGTTDTTQMQAVCTQAGGTWDYATSYCDMSNATTCGQGQYWDGTACKSTMYGQTTDTSTQMQDPAYYGRTGDKAGCESNGWYWDPRGHNGAGDCFPSARAPSARDIMERTTTTTTRINIQDDSSELDSILNDTREGGEASEMDRDLLADLLDEIDFVKAKTGGASCSGITKAEEVYKKAYADSAFLASVAPQMHRVFGALHQCEGQIQVLQNLNMLSKKLGILKVAEAEAQAKADLIAKVAAYQADPTTLMDPQSGPDEMRQLWESFEMLKGNHREFQAERGTCTQLENTRADIERWQSGDAEGMEGAPEMDEKSLEMAGKGLTIITDALAKNDKNACKKAMREMERMGSELGMDDSGFQVYDQDQMMLQNIYGDEFDLSSLKAELLEELKAELLGSIKEMIREQITSIVKEQLQIAFADLETRIAESVILSQVTAQMNTVGAKLASDVQDEMNTVFAERLSYYPPDFHEEAEANRETAGELLEPIFENVPEDLIKEAGLDDAAEIIYTELLPENVAEDIADPELMLEVENTIASCIDEDGEVIEGKKETLVRMLEEVAEHVDEQTATLAADQKTAGLAPVENFTDADQIPDWGKTALEGAIFAGEESGEPIIKGEGDGSMNSEGVLLRAHAIVMTDRILGTDGNKSEVAGLSDIDWALEGAAALKDLGVIDDSDIRNMGEVSDRGSTITTMVRAMGAANDEVQEAIEQTPWVLTEGGLTKGEAIAELGSAENAEAANFGYATGMMTGQTLADGSKDLDFKGEFNRIQSGKVAAVAKAVMNTVESEGADTLVETIKANFAGIIDPIY